MEEISSRRVTDCIIKLINIGKLINLNLKDTYLHRHFCKNEYELCQECIFKNFEKVPRYKIVNFICSVLELYSTHIKNLSINRTIIINYPKRLKKYAKNIKTILEELFSIINDLPTIIQIIGKSNNYKLFLKYKKIICDSFGDINIQNVVFNNLCTCQNRKIVKETLQSLNFDLCYFNTFFTNSFSILKSVGWATNYVGLNKIDYQLTQFISYDDISSSEPDDDVEHEKIINIFVEILRWNQISLFRFILNVMKTDIKFSKIIVSILNGLHKEYIIDDISIEEYSKLAKKILFENKSLIFENPTLIKNIIKESGRKIYSHYKISYVSFCESYYELNQLWTYAEIYNIISNSTLDDNFKKQYLTYMNQERKTISLIGTEFGGYDSSLIIPSLDGLFGSIEYI